MRIRSQRFPRLAPVALCALVLVGSCSNSPSGPTAGAVGLTPNVVAFTTVNSSKQLTANVTDQSGHPIAGASVTWSSMFPGVATVGAGGLVTAAGFGVDTVVATSGSAKGQAVITVSQVAAGITKQAGDAQSYATGATLPQALTVHVVDSGGAGVVGQPVTFAVASGGGSIVEHSAFTDLNGMASVHWALGGTVGSQSVTATIAPLSAVTFTATAAAAGSPTAMTLLTGDGQTGLDTFPVNIPPAVVVKDASGRPVSGVSVTFAVTAGSGTLTGATPTTDANGVAAVGSWKIQNGGNTLRATSASVTADTVTFSATGQPARYNIQIQYVVPVSPTRHAAVDSAVAKWSRIIFDSVSTVPVTLGAGQCFSPQSPALNNQNISGVLIFIQLDKIDGPGKILGKAGPCIIRTSNRLPLVGIIQLDTADLALLETNGELNEVILHEMGHVLGYGTIWDPLDLGLLVGAEGDGGTDPHFVGGRATAAFETMGGQNYTGGAVVPVENVAQAGTADGHWRESVFHTELMTGFLNPGVPNPLSVLTIAAMGDEGYKVNYAAADTYSQTFSVRAPGAPASAPIYLLNDVLHGPVYMMDRAGRITAVIQR